MREYGATSTLCVLLFTVGRIGLAALTHYRDIVGMLSHLSVSSCLFSDVLCPSVWVEGDRFKHTNGGSKEITGKSDSNRQDCFRVQHAHLRVSFLALPSFSSVTSVLVEWLELCRWP